MKVFLITSVIYLLFQAVSLCQVNQSKIEISEYRNCTTLSSSNRSILAVETSNIKPFPRFHRKLKKAINISIIVRDTKYKEIDFSNIDTWQGGSLIIIRNPNLKRIIIPDTIWKFAKTILIRGNRKYAADERTINQSETFDRHIQPNYECSFSEELTSSNEYADCKHVFGHMIFDEKFQDVVPKDMKLQLDGCLIVRHSIIRAISPWYYVKMNCSDKSEFTYNKHMCTDQVKHLIRYQKHNNISHKYDALINCAKGECYGGFVNSKWSRSYLGCEVVKGALEINEMSGNLGDNINDLSYARQIEGAFVIKDNPYVKSISMPLLRSIKSIKCPALIISNMTNLEEIIFHHSIEILCKQAEQPMIVIEGNPKLKLHLGLLYQFYLVPHEINMETHEIDHLKYFSVSIVVCIALFTIMEIFLWFQSKEIFHQAVGGLPNSTKGTRSSTSTTTIKRG